MTILNEGIEKIRNLINANLTKAQNGTGTTTVNPDDTGLETAVGATLKTTTNNTSKGLLTTTHTLTTTDANGITLTEFENQFSTGESLTRIRHVPIVKDENKELIFITTYEILSD